MELYDEYTDAFDFQDGTIGTKRQCNSNEM